jgi:ssDNA-binding Zn-finger/Zn-ribbon topoisomerase 1
MSASFPQRPLKPQKRRFPLPQPKWKFVSWMPPTGNLLKTFIGRSPIFGTKEKGENSQGKAVLKAIEFALDEILEGFLRQLDLLDWTTTIAKMEGELDTIANGKQDYLDVMKDFYGPFHHAVEKASGMASTIKKSLQQTTEDLCELCGKPMIIKWGRNGRFMACSGYPACKNTRPLEGQEPKEVELRDYWKVILKRKWTIISFTFIILIATGVMTFTMSPIHRSTATIQIDRENPQVVDFKEIFSINTTEMDYYQTQYKILESRSLAKRVIQTLNLSDHHPVSFSYYFSLISL